MRAHLLALLLPLLPACAPTALAGQGDVARYAPAYAGYTVGGDAAPVVLRDPVTNEKIRCHEDLERVAPVVAEALADDEHDRAARLAADVGAAPFTALGYVGSKGGEALLFPAVKLLTLALEPTGRRERYAEARRAFLAGRFAEARALFLAVLVGQNGIDPLPRPLFELCTYYLGVCDEQLHRDVEAGDALRRFLTSASAPDEARYRDAEIRLARLAPGALPACQSRAELRLSWPRSP